MTAIGTYADAFDGPTLSPIWTSAHPDNLSQKAGWLEISVVSSNVDSLYPTDFVTGRTLAGSAFTWKINMSARVSGARGALTLQPANYDQSVFASTEIEFVNVYWYGPGYFAPYGNTITVEFISGPSLNYDTFQSGIPWNSTTELWFRIADIGAGVVALQTSTDGVSWTTKKAANTPQVASATHGLFPDFSDAMDLDQVGWPSLRKMETLTDNFDGAAFDTTKWAEQENGPGTLVQSGGAVSLTPAPSAFGTGYSRFYAPSDAPQYADSYSLRDSYIFWQTRAWPDATAHPYFGVFEAYGSTPFPAGPNELAQLNLVFDTTAMTVRADLMDNYVYFATTTVTFVPASMRWWRLKDDAAGLILEYAASFTGPWTRLLQATGLRPSVNGGLWPEWEAGYASGTARPWLIELVNIAPCYPSLEAHVEAVTASGTTATATIAPAGVDRALLVMVCTDATSQNDQCTGVTFGGQAAHEMGIRLYTLSAQYRMTHQLFLVVAPSTGTGTITATLRSTCRTAIIAAAFSGVHQTHPVASTWHGEQGSGGVYPGREIIERYDVDDLVWQASVWAWDPAYTTSITEQGTPQDAFVDATRAGQGIATTLLWPSVVAGHGVYQGNNSWVSGSWHTTITGPYGDSTPWAYTRVVHLRGSCLGRFAARPMGAGYGGWCADSADPVQNEHHGRFMYTTTFDETLGMTALSLGAQHGLAIGTDHKVYGFGQPFEAGPAPTVTPLPGLVLTNTPSGRYMALTAQPFDPAILVDPVSVCAGNGTSHVVLADGRVFAAGSGGSGILGNGSTVGTNAWVDVTPPGVHVVEVAAAYASTACRDGAGNVYVVGDTTSGILGNGTVPAGPQLAWVQVPLPKPAARVTAWGQTNTLAVLCADGTAYWWGTDYGNAGGDNYAAQRNVPTLLPKTGIVQLATLGWDTAVLLNDGSIWVWGSNFLASYVTPHQLPPAFSGTPVWISQGSGCNADGFFVRTNNGSLYGVGGETPYDWATWPVGTPSKSQLDDNVYALYPDMWDTATREWRGEQMSGGDFMLYPMPPPVPTVLGLRTFAQVLG